MLNKEIQPSIEFKNYIENYWIFETDDFSSIPKQLIYPEPTVSLFFHYAAPFKSGKLDEELKDQPFSLLCMQKTFSFESLPSGSIGLFAVNFKPAGASFFFDLPYKELCNTNLELASILGDKINIINEKLFDATEVKTKTQIVENFLKSQIIDKGKQDIELLNRAIEFISGNPMLNNVDKVSRHSFTTNRTLERLFNKRLGLTPKQFIKIKRMNFAFSMMLSRSGKSLIDISYESGYYDQSHLNKDFKEMVGVKPKKIIELVDSDFKS